MYPKYTQTRRLYSASPFFPFLLLIMPIRVYIIIGRCLIVFEEYEHVVKVVEGEAALIRMKGWDVRYTRSQGGREIQSPYVKLLKLSFVPDMSLRLQNKGSFCYQQRDLVRSCAPEFHKSTSTRSWTFYCLHLQVK